MSGALTPTVIDDIVGLLPDAWLAPGSSSGERDRERTMYADYLTGRLQPPRVFIEEAIRARSLHL
jgi:hypothetical protein